eukprot:TRINITY_DN27918_c0_g1_i1.p1 TRINITY_DN27918_c0_g1~~TRINITY_DN27918_c0_g1_i1.p1  ORF type:complete len:303 (+),score=47.79 TRINITY_DN27918_c0_g1_i1:169-1077(+)
MCIRDRMRSMLQVAAPCAGLLWCGSRSVYTDASSPLFAAECGWDENWDGRADRSELPGPTRHIILIRHGQYNRSSQERELTPLGIQQALLTGERLAAMCNPTLADKLLAEPDGLSKSPITIACVHSSNLPRARQTAELVAKGLPGVSLAPMDPMLAEGCPCIPVPAPVNYDPSPATVWEDAARIEAAFRHYIHRAVGGPAPSQAGKDDHQIQAEGVQDDSNGASSVSAGKDSHSETWEVIVCHGNVIRYFVCRALQLPPQAWLRMATYNCGMTHLVIRPNGRCSLLGFGDVGHLALEQTTYF